MYPKFLYVQLAEGGTWTQSEDDPEIYELALYGIASQTAYFSDRPERIVGTMETVNFSRCLASRRSIRQTRPP